MLPRVCPLCGNRTIIGHGRRLKQAHDQRHEQIRVRRGLCRPCQKTFTVLPDWSPPSGHYSLHCRQEAWELLCQADGNWERSVPDVADVSRSPDPSTVRRWAGRLLNLGTLLMAKLWQIFGRCGRREQEAVATAAPPIALKESRRVSFIEVAVALRSS